MREKIGLAFQLEGSNHYLARSAVRNNNRTVHQNEAILVIINSNNAEASRIHSVVIGLCKLHKWDNSNVHFKNTRAIRVLSVLL